MRLLVRTTNLSLTPALNAYIEEKIGGLAKFLKSFDPNTLEVRVEVGRDSSHHKKGDVFFTEVNLRIGGEILRSKSFGSDMYLVIDEVKDDLSREINRFSKKKEALFLRGARSLSKLFRLSPLARFFRKGRIKDDYL